MRIAAHKYGDLSGREPPEPLGPGDHLCPEAKRALEDFEFFRAHYLGHVSLPWHIEAAEQMAKLLESPEKEFVVVNCPPGTGKSTLFTYDIPLWLIVRDRAVRIFIGSRTHSSAKNYTRRIRNALARTRPAPPDEEQIVKGLAVPPEGCLSLDYGRFKPENRDLWRGEEFVVEQTHGEGSAEKEPTVTAWGRDTEFLGFRADFIVWDDLVTARSLQTLDTIEKDRDWYEDEAESRVEPGGVFVLQGQRMGPDDLYRHALNMKTVGEDEEDDTDAPPKYRHIIFKAHYEEHCREQHTRDAPAHRPRDPANGGCLLDPRRCSWRELQTHRRNREQKFRVQYQQEDVDPASVLVQKVWVSGGRDPEDGALRPGCWDAERLLGQVPQGLAAPVLSIATADPSPSKYWAIEWWIVHPPSNQRFLIDLIKQSMGANEFLDWNANQGIFTGIMEEWQVRSRAQGYPITHWIVEENAAQRFLLQYDHVHRWMRQHSVSVIPHGTYANKRKPAEEYGVWVLQDIWKHGLVRLPGGGSMHTPARAESRNAANKLVDEVTRYERDTGTNDDCLMAQWFLEFHLPRLVRSVTKPKGVKPKRPSWLGRARVGAAA